MFVLFVMFPYFVVCRYCFVFVGVALFAAVFRTAIPRADGFDSDMILLLRDETRQDTGNSPTSLPSYLPSARYHLPLRTAATQRPA